MIRGRITEYRETVRKPCASRSPFSFSLRLWSYGRCKAGLFVSFDLNGGIKKYHLFILPITFLNTNMVKYIRSPDDDYHAPKYIGVAQCFPSFEVSLCMRLAKK